MRRAALENPALFFYEARRGKSLRQLALQLDAPYSSLKSWARGGRTIPEGIFRKLVALSNRPVYWEKAAVFKASDWGRSKGGKTRFSRMSRKSIEKAMSKVRESRSSSNIRSPPLNERLCELYGALMGDGCLSRYRVADGYERYEIIITGDKELDTEYHEYLAGLMKELFGLSPYIYKRKDSRSRKLSVKNRKLFEFFVSLGFPVGNKGNSLAIPKRFVSLPWEQLRCIIRGIFDTDGCITAKKNEKYRYPYIIISSKSKPLTKQLHQILRSRGYPCYIKKNEKELRIKGIRNTVKWMGDIGSSNTRHLKKYSYWKKNGIVPVNAIDRAGRSIW